jgi:alpha-1,2-mannosyltransferase
MLKISPYVLGAVVIFALLYTISPALPFLLLLAIGVPLFATFLVLRLRFHGNHRPQTVAFFHPFADAKGGGERVLWALLHSLLQSPSLANARFIIYTDYRDNPNRNASTILAGATSTFGISLPTADTRVDFIYLKRYKWLESSSWKRLTLLMQEIGAIVPALEALSIAVPDVVIDTHGHSFVYPVFRLLGRCLVLSYTHYPTVSKNMLQRVRDRTVMPNNSAAIARSPVLSSLKLAYYQLFARLYRYAGNCAERVMVNSSWTYGHLHSIWQPSDDAMLTVYPPCPVDALRALPLDGRQPLIVSVAQFRPGNT